MVVLIRWRPGIGLACAIAAGLLAGCADTTCDSTYLYCEDDDYCAPTPANCRQSAPTAGQLHIELSSPAPVLVRIYRGTNYETGTLVWSGRPPTSLSWSMTVPVNDYSATALYVTDGDSVLAIDGVSVLSTAQETCDGTCYSSGIGELDLRLKD